MSYIAAMRKRLSAAEAKVKELERENMLLASKLSSFFTGDVPQHATIDHMILAKAGRQRLQEKAKTAVLLAKPSSH